MQRKPQWLKVRLPGGKNFNKVNAILNSSNLHTVCHSAKCPNIAECFGRGTATFMILGNRCTRNCRYCSVEGGKPAEVDEGEPKRVAEAIKKLNLRYAVITSVTRDDLEDGGAGIFADTVNEIKKINKKIKIELLIPDFKGNKENLKKIINAKPDVLGHNIEVTENLFKALRPLGDYSLSIQLLKNIKKINPNQKTKSGLMVGLGEAKEDIVRTMKDLREAEVDFLAIGQYMQPRRDLAEVKRFYSPEEFNYLKETGLELGFEHVESGPLVRSSYRADAVASKIRQNR
jgi:lipoic acid synthetase